MTARRLHTDGAWSAPLPPGSERRRRQRIDSVIRATVRAPHSDTAPLRARAIDLCEHGARLLVRRRLAEEVPLELDLECELPLRVHLGYDIDSLVIDGPMHTHLVRLRARVVRCTRREDRMYEVGVEFVDDGAWHDLQIVQSYVDHLREYETERW